PRFGHAPGPERRRPGRAARRRHLAGRYDRGRSARTRIGGRAGRDTRRSDRSHPSLTRARSVVTRSKNRSPHLETRGGPQHIVPPPTLEDVLVRSQVAGRAAALSPSELRRGVERAASDRAHPTPLDEAWQSVTRVFGATAS